MECNIAVILKYVVIRDVESIAVEPKPRNVKMRGLTVGNAVPQRL